LTGLAARLAHSDGSRAGASRKFEVAYNVCLLDELRR
jgi:hypothetical protein